MIQVENLTFQYPKSKGPAIRDINFQIKKGEIFGFLGPSGAGKSTIQKVLIGILREYKGSVKVFNQEVNKTNHQFYERIGVAFEFPNFYHKLTGYENLELFRKLYSVPTLSSKELLQLVDLEDAMNVKFKHYSKGMKMRLNFCRALLNNPDILFLDEPTSGLDPVNARKMKNLILKKKSKGTTVILTTHNMHVAEELCDRIAFIVDGKVVLVDSPGQLKRKYGKKAIKVTYLENGVEEEKEFSIEQIGYNETFLEIIKSNPILTMHTQEATLEDIFIKVTGRSLQ